MGFYLIITYSNIASLYNGKKLTSKLARGILGYMSKVEHGQQGEARLVPIRLRPVI